MVEETLNKTVQLNPDSIEIGTPGKGGALKVYGDFSIKGVFQAKIDNALEIRAYAQSKMESD